MLDRHESRSGRDRLSERVERHPAGPVDRNLDHLESLRLERARRLEHGGVLDGGDDDARRLPRGARGARSADHREVAGLGAAGGEHDLFRASSERLRDGRAGAIELDPSDASTAVKA